MPERTGQNSQCEFSCGIRDAGSEIVVYEGILHALHSAAFAMPGMKSYRS